MRWVYPINTVVSRNCVQNHVRVVAKVALINGEGIIFRRRTEARETYFSAANLFRPTVIFSRRWRASNFSRRSAVSVFDTLFLMVKK